MYFSDDLSARRQCISSFLCSLSESAVRARQWILGKLFYTFISLNQIEENVSNGKTAKRITFSYLFQSDQFQSLSREILWKRSIEFSSLKDSFQSVLNWKILIDRYSMLFGKFCYCNFEVNSIIFLLLRDNLVKKNFTRNISHDHFEAFFDNG